MFRPYHWTLRSSPPEQAGGGCATWVAALLPKEPAGMVIIRPLRTIFDYLARRPDQRLRRRLLATGVALIGGPGAFVAAYVAQGDLFWAAYQHGPQSAGQQAYDWSLATGNLTALMALVAVLLVFPRLGRFAAVLVLGLSAALLACLVRMWGLGYGDSAVIYVPGLILSIVGASIPLLPSRPQRAQAAGGRRRWRLTWTGR